MKTADSMFEELGYRRKGNKYFIEYIKEYEYVAYRIVFCIEQKCVEFCNDSNGYFTRFNPSELQAINEKCKELRMDMSKCSKKCNEIKERIDSISGLDDDFVYGKLEEIHTLVNFLVGQIEKYADEDNLNGTCFKRVVR